jgi:hypothetical protein
MRLDQRQAGAEIEITKPMLEAGLEFLQQSGILWNEFEGNTLLIEGVLTAALRVAGYELRMSEAHYLVR